MAKYLGRAQGNQKGPASGQRADLEAIGQAHISAVASACLSIGIKFAGSANAAAEKVLRHYVLYFLKAKQQAPDSSAGKPLTACFNHSCTHEKLTLQLTHHCLNAVAA